VLGASAAAALLLITKEASTAQAAARATILGTSITQYGVAGIDSSWDPNTFLGNLGTRTFGVIGVWEVSMPAPANAGVLGQATGHVGVLGLSTNVVGVFGQSQSGTGVQGISATGDGILGFSSGNLKYGLAGTGSGQAHGLIGYSANQFGISGIKQNGNNWAGAFFNAQATSPSAGRKGLFVQGDFLVLNGTKNAGVKTQKHGYRKMYAVEATENVFEDFGTAALKNGKARVDLDDVFAETVNTAQKYQVYLTPSGDTKGLYVSGRDARGFTVQEAQGGSGSFEFDYRVVAKVRGYEGTRMEQFEPPTMPPTPEPTKSPDSAGPKRQG
jgi:hypothetical protein